MGAGKVAGPTIIELKRRGHETLLLADDGGQAKKSLPAGTFELVGNMVDLDFRIREHQPTVFVAGLSASRELEFGVDQYAFEYKKPLVLMEDYWGVHVRAAPPSAAVIFPGEAIPYDVRKPDLIITVDQAGEHLIREGEFAKQNSWFKNAEIAIAGIPAILPVTSPDWLLEQYEQKRRETGAHIILFPDDEVDWEDAMEIFKASVALTRTPVLFVPRIRGIYKDVSHPNGEKTWGKWIEEEFRPLRERGLIWDLPKPTTDEIAELPGIGVCAGFSSVLLRAAKKGNVALTMWNPATARNLKKATSLDQTPLMMQGGFPVLTEPRSLDDILSAEQPKLELKAFDPAIAADAIEKLCN
jgi:hypothetical protein